MLFGSNIVPVVAILGTQVNGLDLVLPNWASNRSEAVPVKTSVGTSAFDGVYTPVQNDSTYEWWYFDAVSSDLGSSVTFQPIMGQLTTSLGVQLSGTFPNGTLWKATLPDSPIYFSTSGDSSSGVATSGIYSWQSASDMLTYDISIDAPEQGVTGNIHYQVVAPAHGPEAGNLPGSDLTLRWNLLWANAVPDAVTLVNLNVSGTAVAFTGIGYHDKNWGPAGFARGLNQWYWGHARCGEYSIVWFYVVESANTTVSSGYIARGNEIIYAAKTTDSATKVRPYGDGVAFPVPVNFDRSFIRGFEIEVDAAELGLFMFNASNTNIVAGSEGVYSRWIGSVTGGLEGEAECNGTGVWEQMYANKFAE